MAPVPQIRCFPDHVHIISSGIICFFSPLVVQIPGVKSNKKESWQKQLEWLEVRIAVQNKRIITTIKFLKIYTQVL